MKKRLFSLKRPWIAFIILIMALTMALGAVQLWAEDNNNMADENGNSVPNGMEKEQRLTIVPTMLDAVSADSAWCGTFQLVWNDMKNEVVKGDVIFNPQMEMVENLNKGTFTSDMLSDDYYYKKWGKKTPELKAEIEQGIKDKFDETSDVLDDIDWSEGALDDPYNPIIDRYLFYVMLKRKFEYPIEFTKLPESEFNGKSGVTYFGIDDTTGSEVKKQVEVLYYTSQDDFAFLVGTKGDDELIFVKNPEGSTFDAIYKDVEQKASGYWGNKDLDKRDGVKIPNLNFNEKRVYDELAGHEFPTECGVGEIMKAIQTLKFSLDEKGGEVKSESTIDILTMSALPESRNFYLDGTFALFIREKGQPQPYFAAHVDDIAKFQMSAPREL